MSKNNDYQNKMSNDTSSLDTQGNQAAEAATVANFAVGKEQVREDMGNGMTMVHDVAKFGMMPTQAIPLDHAIERKSAFEKESERTRVSYDAFGGHGSDSKAYTSQVEMMNNYGRDIHRLPDAQRDYNIMVPLANAAAKALVKANTVGEWGGFNQDTDLSAGLNGKENKALGKAMGGEHMDEAASVSLTADGMKSARVGMVSASHVLAGALDRIAMKKLGDEKSKTEADKATIEAKIAKIVQIVGYAETAGAMIAGGAGFVDSQLPGAPEAVMTADLKQDGAGKVKKVGEGIEKGGGIAGKVVGMAAQFYYQGELDRLDAHIATLTAQIGVEQEDNEYRDIMAARATFEKAQLDYKIAVDKYVATIEDRRSRMADAGHQADLAVDKKGNNSKVGDSMEWATVVMELQSFLTIAMDAGKAAQDTTTQVQKETYKHRTTPWGVLADVAGNGSTNTPRSEGTGDTDYKVLVQMTTLTNDWMTSAAQIQEVADRMAKTNVTPMLEHAGYSGKY